MAMEVIAIRPLYGRDHLDHVLGTFGLLIFFNELVRLVWGPEGRTISLPPEMHTAVQVLPGIAFPELINEPGEALSSSFVLPDEALAQVPRE